MRIVIAGAGEVGCGLAQALADKYDVFVIEKELGRCDSLLNLDVVTIPGNAANLDTLRTARIENADIFLAVTGNDEVNLLAGLAAKKLGAKKVIVRVENPEYVDRPIIKDHPLGYDVLICPQLALAQEAARLVGLPGAIEIVSFSGGKVEMVEVQIMEGSKADGCRIKDLDLPKNIVITSIYRSGNLIIPRGETLLEKGDKIAIVGKSEEIERIRGLFGPPIVRRVTIFGAGTIGSYVAKILERSRISVKLVESRIDRCEQISDILKGVKIVCGDATDIEFLAEEEVGKSDAVVAATESDEKNLLICLLAKNLGVKTTIAKVERGEYVKLFEAVGIDIALNPRRVTYNEVMKLLRRMQVETVAEIEGAAVVEVVVKNKKLIGTKLRDIDLPRTSIVGAVLRNDECLVPRGDTELNLGDRLLVFTTWDDLEFIEEIFE